MVEPIDEAIDVVFVSHAPPRDEKKKIEIYKFRWRGREYRVLQTTYVYPVWRGRTRVYMVSLVTNTLDFRVEIDTDTFICTIKEISDGLTD